MGMIEDGIKKLKKKEEILIPVEDLDNLKSNEEKLKEEQEKNNGIHRLNDKHVLFVKDWSCVLIEEEERELAEVEFYKKSDLFFYNRTFENRLVQKLVDLKIYTKGKAREFIARNGLKIKQIHGLLRNEVLDERDKQKGEKRGFKAAIEVFNQDFNKLAQDFIQIQPMYYDHSKIWFLWDKEKSKYVMTDEIDIMIMIDSSIDDPNTKTSRSSTKSEILESLRKAARSTRPKDLPKKWIQFQDRIVDLEKWEFKDPVPEYFCMNPIPWKYGETDDTPKIDKLFEDWVGPEWKQTLYEILAYCMLPDYPFHLMFWLYGAGSNGKSVFLRLLNKFIGADNICTSDLNLLINNRFEVAKLYKKLVCQIGETDFSMLKNTQLIKRLTGDDKVGFEFKNKNPFDDYSYAKIIIATNSIPETTDNTKGYWRRNMIIDFPNEFEGRTDIIATIPDEEYEALANRCCNVLKDLLENRYFHKEGSIEIKQKRYEERSNPFQKFIDMYCKENPFGFVYTSEFTKRYQTFLVKNGHRIWSKNEIGRKMKENYKRVYRDAPPEYLLVNPEKKGQRWWAYEGVSWNEKLEDVPDVPDVPSLSICKPYVKNEMKYVEQVEQVEQDSIKQQLVYESVQPIIEEDIQNDEDLIENSTKQHQDLLYLMLKSGPKPEFELRNRISSISDDAFTEMIMELNEKGKIFENPRGTWHLA